MRITVDEAREYFAHPSQQVFGIKPEYLPGDPFEYWADGPLCGVVHPSFWPRVWVVHFAAKPEGWGHVTEPAKRLLREFWEEKQPDRLIGWTPANLRGALALTRRVGFIEDGRLPLPGGDVVMSGWSLQDGS